MRSEATNRANLTCPYCGADYQQGVITCPQCGKPVSPTGYTSYVDEVEPMPPSKPTAQHMLAEQASIRRIEQNAAQVVAARNRRVNNGIAVAVWAVIIIGILAFLLMRVGGRVFTVRLDTPTPAPTYTLAGPTPTMAILPDPDAGKVKVNHVRVLDTGLGRMELNIYDIGSRIAVFPPAEVFAQGQIKIGNDAVVIDVNRPPHTPMFTWGLGEPGDE